MRCRPLSNFIDFACYVSLFPQLVAGPIIRFSEIADQLRERTHTVQKFARDSLAGGLPLADDDREQLGRPHRARAFGQQAVPARHGRRFANLVVFLHAKRSAGRVPTSHRGGKRG